MNRSHRRLFGASLALAALAGAWIGSPPAAAQNVPLFPAGVMVVPVVGVTGVAGVAVPPVVVAAPAIGIGTAHAHVEKDRERSRERGNVVIH
jgi:hypothetical protein